jgi:hypothetical protein
MEKIFPLISDTPLGIVQAIRQEVHLSNFLRSDETAPKISTLPLVSFFSHLESHTSKCTDANPYFTSCFPMLAFILEPHIGVFLPSVLF